MLSSSKQQITNRNPDPKKEGHSAKSDNPIVKSSDSSSQTTWLGTQNQDWKNPGNWSNGIPNARNHAYIPPTSKYVHAPVISDFITISFTLKIDGHLYNKGRITIMPKGLIQNDGFLKIASTGALINQGKIHNSGTIQNLGYIDNKAVFSNNGAIDNEGTFDNESTLITLKNFLNTGTIDSDADLDANRQIENFNQINIFSE